VTSTPFKALVVFVLAVIVIVSPSLIIVLLVPGAVPIGDRLVGFPFGGLSAFWDGLLDYLLLPLVILVGGLVGGAVLTPLYLLVHWLVYRRSRFYGFVRVRRPQSMFRWLRRAILPSLFGVQAGLILATGLVGAGGAGLVVWPPLVASASQVSQILLTWTYTLLIGLPITFALVTPTWVLDDAGLVISNVPLKPSGDGEEADLPQVSGVGTWLSRLLKGYAGIAVVLSYATIMTGALAEAWLLLISNPAELAFFLGDLIIFPLMPVYLMFLSLPLIIVFDRMRGWIQRYVHRLGKRIAINKSLSVVVEVKG
jgi:hypothetical protein